MAQIIHLIRHGEIASAYRQRYIGRTDPPLSETGREACRYLAALACDRVFSSPLRRARETAALIPGEAAIDPRLAEIDFGRWENLTFAEIEAVAPPELLRCWMETPEQMVFPGGESVREFQFCVDAVFSEVTRHPAPRIAVVTHGGVLMRILSHLHGVPAARQFEFLPARGALVTLERKGDFWHVKS